jgi:uncharacterized protein (DUF111 family)
VLAALARPNAVDRVAEAMIRATSTLGVRTCSVQRLELAREHQSVEVDGQRISVKVGRLGSEVVNVAPEHDDVARAAAALGRPVKIVWAAAHSAAHVRLADA